MKLIAQALPKHLAQTLLPLYWVSGDEPLLHLETTDMIRQAAKQQGYLNREIFYIDQGMEWGSFTAATQNLSLFADKSFIELRLGDKKLPDVGKKALQHYLENPAADKVILVISSKLDAATLKTKWFQEIEATAGHIQIWPVTLNDLPAWIKTRLNQANLTADQEAIDFLVECSEGNLLALKQSIEKLSLIFPQQNITLAQVQAVITDAAHFDLFSLVDTALAGNAVRVLRILTALKNEGTEPILILWALLREIRVLANIKAMTKTGQTEKTLLQQQRVWPQRIPLLQKALTRSLDWQSLLPIAFKIDAMIKGLRSGNYWHALEELVLAMSGVRLRDA